MDEKLLKIKKEIKAKKPKFIRQDAHKKARLRKCWRKPKGLHSKMRLRKGGYRSCVSPGYGTPATLRGKNKKGIIPVEVNNLSDLKKIEESQGAVISTRVGQKKRMEIAKKASELGIKILNIKNIEEYLKKVNQEIQKKKEAKQTHMKEKEKKKEEREKKASEKKKEDLAEKVTDEEKKEQEKKEREKILTKKEN